MKKNFKDQLEELEGVHSSKKPMPLRVIMVILSSVLMAFSLNFFVYNTGLLPAGFSGVAILLQEIARTFFNIEISYSVLYPVLNILPAIIAYKTIGHRFFWLSCLQVIMTSLLVDIFPKIQIADDIVLATFIGAAVTGIGNILALNANASAGGTDFIAMAISNKRNKTVWNQVLVFNMIVLSISGFLFGWTTALWSIIFQFTDNRVINQYHLRYQRLTLLFVVKKEDAQDLADELIDLTHHTVTAVDGKGLYTNSDRVLLYMVIGKEDLPIIRKFIDQHEEKKIFLNIINSGAIEGNFYLKPLD